MNAWPSLPDDVSPPLPRPHRLRVPALDGSAAVAFDGVGFDYVNHFEVGCGPYEVLLRFAQVFDEVGTPARRIGVVMTPPYAKALALMLSGVIDRFEAEYGVLPAAGLATEDDAIDPHGNEGELSDGQ